MFSGIRAPEVAMPWIDWKWAADIEKFPNAVGRRHFKHVPNLGDVNSPTFIERAKSHGPIDLLVFGSPCQSYSVAGKRLGLDDPRGNLALVALGIIAKLRPRWFVFENVPGLFSSWSGGPQGKPVVDWRVLDCLYREFEESSDFASFLSSVRDIGYFGAYRTLDAQFFGVPQRRRRIFFVGNSGDWRHSAAVLFEQESLSRHFAPRREKRQGVTGSLAARTRGGGGLGTDFDCDGGLLVAPTLDQRAGGSGANSFATSGGLVAAPLTSNPYADNEAQESKLVAMCLNAKNNRFDGESQTFVTHSLRADGFDASEDGTGRGTPLVAVPILEAGARTGKSTSDIRAGVGIGESGDPMFTLQSGKQHAVAFQSSQSGVREHETHATLDSNNGPRRRNGIMQGMAVRRLTPIECARLQGFPDTFCHIYRNKKRKITPETAAYYRSHGLKCFLRDGQWFTLIAADGPIYKAYGNSMAIPVLRWIGDRIRQVQERTS
jgi:DNA (cytosine-5)-methyltransferase 1